MSGHPRTGLIRSLKRPSERWLPRQRSHSFSVVASLLPSAGRSEARGPELCMQRPDGAHTRILEDDLYRYTRHRWLFNEQTELSKRYLKFNLQGLIDVAVSVCEGARYCTKVVKCSEGLRNKLFLLRMNNGKEVIAKLPNPSAGPAKYTTASEVATHELLRTVFKLPVPQILAWSYDATANPVGAEYIISEKPQGVRLGSVWKQWRWKAKMNMIQQITHLENTLTSISFPSHGCIYFKDDLRLLTGKADDIDIGGAVAQDLSRFAIGPLSSPELWEGTRGEMDLDRGPWSEPSDYTRAMGWNEIAWIREHAQPRLNYYISSESIETPSNGVALLSQYMNAAAYLIPPPADDASLKVLWHPDLGLDSVFVDPETQQITSIVDWQFACVAPLLYQSGIPRMFQQSDHTTEDMTLPERPANFESLSDAEKRDIDNELEHENMHKYYEAMVYKQSPCHWAVLSNPSVRALREPISFVTKAWEKNSLFYLRQSLISMAEKWDELFPETGLPCPIRFTDGDLEVHQKEKQNMQGVGAILALLRDGAVLPSDGMVEPEDYEMACRNNRKFKEVFIKGAEDEAERELFTKIWPYQESV
ncbi:phosphotransferase enzyme family protein [Aspergillus granulosus]|uniref:Phosphotransferase enzyme family protein n=1 Tax=Aspergillus granulosus TaxID=176169 RepID=A0ABR4GZA3_9EURO